jgi:nucleoside-diphosphate-sugar epimerase
MRCFITGAAGFIGSHLAEELVAAGHDVTGFDDLSTGRLDNLREDDDRVIGSPLKSRWSYAEAKATRNLDEIIQAVAAEQSSAPQAAA